MVRHWESRVTQKFDRCEVVSELDQKILQNSYPQTSIEVVPNGVDTEAYRPLPRTTGTPTLLFVGKMDYIPCEDAVLYFSREIFPLVQKQVPDLRLLIVGVNPSPKVIQLNSAAIHVTGRVADIIPYYRQSSLCVVPLRAAGGTRLKILEAMALGRPVVSTSIGAEGLDVVDGKHLLIADSPEAFGEKVLLLLKNPDQYHQVAEQARRLVETRYDWNCIANRLNDMYADLSSSNASPKKRVGHG
jgi:glycosyltransferase involved in cell wall biosynthesis